MSAKCFLFNKKCYSQLDVDTNKVDYRRLIKCDWFNLPTDFCEDVDDIVNLSGKGLLYFFKKDKYVTYSITNDKVDGPEKTISDNWPGMKEAGFDRDIDAAIHWVTTQTHDPIYFFKGDQYLKFSISANKVIGGPSPIAGNWPGMKEVGFDRDLDAVVLWPNGNAYFFKGDMYVKFDIPSNRVFGSPASIKENWGGVEHVQAVTMLGQDGHYDPCNPCGNYPGHPGDKKHGPGDCDCDCHDDPCPDPNQPHKDDPCNNNGKCGGKCGDNPQGGRQCFTLPANTKFGLNALINSGSTQTIKVFIDDKQVDTLTGSGVGNINPGAKTYNSGSGKVCIEVWANGKMSPLRYADNPLDSKPGMAVIGTEDGHDNDYNDAIVVLNWGLN